MKKKIIICLLILMLIVIPTKVEAKTLGQMKKELSAAEAKLNETNTQKAINKQSIDETNSKISKIQSDINQTQKDIDAKTEESKKLEQEISLKNEEIKDLMRYYQVSSAGSGLLEYVMGAESLTDLIYRLSITEQISNYNKKMIKQMNDMIAENEKIKQELAAKKEELVKLKSDLSTQLIVLNEKQSKLSDEGLSESEAIKEMKNQIKYYESLKCKDNEDVGTCYSNYFAAKVKNSSGSVSGGYLPSGTTFFRPTASGRMSSGYGNRTLRGAANLHLAVDIATPVGTPVYSVAPGLVTKTIKSSSGGGNQIVIQHYVNGQYYTSYYCHLSVIGVSAGTVVTKDTIIGKSGNTGNSTGPHLHLGMATGRWYIDYYKYYGTSDSFQSHSFDPRNVITFPPIGSSYSNR